MSLLKLTFASLRFRAMSHVFNLLVLALGMALVLVLARVSHQAEQRFDADLRGIDLVVGAKGSPLQLILSSVFHIDVPNGNIPLDEADALARNRLVGSSIPVALGDNYHLYRIVGTTQDYAKHYNAELAQGVWWNADMQAVLGSEVASATGLALGQSFAGSHGLGSGGEEHTATPYVVTGIMKPTGTVLDRLILCSVASIWNVHRHDPDEPEQADAKPEITSLLITYRTPLAAASLPRLVNASTSMQAASPAMEVARLNSLMGGGADILKAFAAGLMTLAAAGAFLTMLAAVRERRYDLALLRTLGMTRSRIFFLVMGEGLLLGIAGALCGWAIGMAASAAITRWMEASRHIHLASLPLQTYELGLMGACVALCGCAALIPAVMAYRINIAAVLSRRN